MLDLDIRTNRLEKEQQKRREDAKRKRDKELRLQREAVQREQQLAQLAARRREQLEKEAAEVALRKEEELRLTGGVRFMQWLSPYCIEGEDDKVILPEDCLQQLTTQEAVGSGVPMSFELSFRSNRGSDKRDDDGSSSSAVNSSTHCGVREFSAPAGMIGLPRKVIDCIIEKFHSNNNNSDSSNITNRSSSNSDAMTLALDGSDLTAWPQLRIKYVRLAKCTYAKLQPKQNRFFDVGPVKLCLEENLRFHSTLTEGDLLTVWYRGKKHQLRVVDMKPAAKGSLVDTDIEIDLELSEELQQLQQQQEKQQQLPLGTSAAATTDGISVTNNSINSTTTTVFRKLSDLPSHIEALDASATKGSSSSTSSSAGDVEWAATELLPEPILSTDTSTAITSGDSSVVALKMKLPNGSSKVRRFRTSDQLMQVFLFVAQEAKLSREQMLKELVISTRFPNRSFRLLDTATVVPATAATTATTSDCSGSSVNCIGQQLLSDVDMVDANIAVIATLSPIIL